MLRLREKLFGIFFKKRLKELKRAESMHIQSEKLSSLGKLVSSMVHEVNNPLMVISGIAQMALMGDIEGDELLGDMKVVQEQCKRTENMMRRLLKFAKPSRGQVVDVDVNKALDLIVGQIELDNVQIIRDFNESIPLVKIDEKQLREVGMDLLKNAAEAMPAGGTITIKTYSGVDGYVNIDFVDTGEGMSKEVIDKIFDPFFTTKEDKAGLGLSVCYGMIKASGGMLEYESDPGKGTVARVVLSIEGETA